MHRTAYALTIVSLLFLPACPNTNSDLGALCDIGFEAGPAQGAYNSAASECSSRICLKPVSSFAAGPVDTGAFCTAGCSTDSDCDGVLRDPNNPNDKTCVSGYTCSVAFVKGSLCCQKLCICKDFTGEASKPNPVTCQSPDSALTCDQ